MLRLSELEAIWKRIDFDEAKHRYRFDGARSWSVTQYLHMAGIIDPRWYTEEARERGEKVHLITELNDQGTLDMNTVDPRLAGYLWAWQTFKEEALFDPILVEPLFGNPVYRYVGKPDRLGKVRGIDLWLPDIKTGKPEPWAGLQTAGYRACIPCDDAIQRMAVQLKDDGSYKIFTYNDPLDADVFLAAVSVVNWRIAKGKLDPEKFLAQAA